MHSDGLSNRYLFYYASKANTVKYGNHNARIVLEYFSIRNLIIVTNSLIVVITYLINITKSLLIAFCCCKKLSFPKNGVINISSHEKTGFIFILTQTFEGNAEQFLCSEVMRLFHPSFHFLRGRFVPRRSSIP